MNTLCRLLFLGFMLVLPVKVSAQYLLGEAILREEFKAVGAERFVDGTNCGILDTIRSAGIDADLAHAHLPVWAIRMERVAAVHCLHDLEHAAALNYHAWSNVHAKRLIKKAKDIAAWEALPLSERLLDIELKMRAGIMEPLHIGKPAYAYSLSS